MIKLFSVKARLLRRGVAAGGALLRCHARDDGP
jgi:hypothetical protein